MGVVGVHIEVEVGRKKGAEKRASLRGGEFRGTASPAHHPRMWSSRRRRGERRVTARRGIPGTVRPELLTGPSTLPWSRDPHQSGMALENRIPTHLKQRQEKKKDNKTSEPRKDADTLFVGTRQSKRIK